ncbi:MAG TPA: NlpC/P60 family protein [Trebonia sp.]
MPLAAAAATVAVLLQGGASQAQTVASKPTVKQLAAQATQLSNEQTQLDQQYDGLKIQLAQANSQAKFAKQAEQRAQAAMAGDQKAVAQLAAMGYMNAGTSATLQMLNSSDPVQFLNQESTVQQVDNEAGMRVSTLQKEQIAAERAAATAKEEITTANQIQAEINSKVTKINATVSTLKSQAMQQAIAQYLDTDSDDGLASSIPLLGSSPETIALRNALTKIHDWYQWGAAGPDEFDCSGLIVWAYEQEGIYLDHYTGDLWNEGTHVAFDDLQPGDLVFFFADLDHVGIYVGTYGGTPYFLDAPATGQQVQIQPMEMGSYDGAVRVS